MTNSNDTLDTTPSKPVKQRPKYINYIIIFVVAYYLGGQADTQPNTNSDKVLTGQEPSASSSQQRNTPSIPPANARRAVVFKGQGGLNDTTAPKTLGGNYKVVWKTNGNCYYSGDLDSDFSENVFTTSSRMTGTNYIYDIAPGTHFLEVTTGPAGSCSWSVKFWPIK